MDLDEFHLFSALHWLTLGCCVALPLAVVFLAGRIRENGAAMKSGRRGIAGGNLVIWIIACGFWFHPDYFRIEQSLPLQFCNLANLIAFAAVGFRSRIARSLLYFWTFALCIWAFLTPFLTVGPSHPWFWVFWLYHLLIPLATAWVMAIDRFRPTSDDLRSAIIVTASYALLLAGLNAATGWNYGFVGPGNPGQPSLIDVLGPYPLRLVWIFLVATVLFILLFLP